MADLIAGKPIPKWVSDEEGIEAVINNIQNKPDEANQSRLKAQEEENKLRERLGICKKCRMRDCLCREGQI